MGGKTATTTQSLQIPPEVMARYRAVNTRAENVAQKPFQQYGGEFVAPITEQQQAGFQNINQAANMAQPYYQGAAGMTLAGSQGVGQLGGQDIQRYMSPYLGSVVGSTLQNLGQEQAMQRQQQLGQGIKAGAFGGDRLGLERANLARQQGMAYGKTAADLLNQGYGQAVQTAVGQQGVEAQNLARLQAGGAQLGGLGSAAQQAALQGAQAQVGAGTLEQQTQQALDTAKYQQFLQERGYDFQVAQFLANIAMGTGALSGSTTTTTQPQSFFSDERLKENIEPVGELNDGQPIYRYNYKGDPRTQIGLIAQDVEQSHPEAVGLAGGYRTVDYGKATDAAAGVMPESMGGAVTRPGAYAAGGMVDPNDLQALIASQAQSFGPFSQAGLYGAKGGGVGAAGYVPSSTLPVGRLMTAGNAPPPPKSGLQQAIGGLDAVSDFGTKMAKGYDVGKIALLGAPGVKGGSGEPDKPGKRGLGGSYGEWGGGYLNPASPPAADLAASGAAKSSADFLPENLSDLDFFSPMAYGGGVMPHYAAGGSVNPYEMNADPLQDVLEDQEKEAPELQKPGQMPGAPPGGAGADIMGGLKAAGSAASAITALMALSDERLKHNVEPIGKLFDGQEVYRYDFGDGRTQMGLMAQDVERSNPQAVGEAGGYKTVNYGDATEGAAGLGAAMRSGYKGGGEVNVPEQYREMIEQASRETGIPASILARQIRTESSFNPNAVGKAGEIGLGQIMPSTARDPGYGVKPVDPESLRDPAQNIAFQARYLAGRGKSAGVKDWNDPEQAAKGVATYNPGDPSYAGRVMGTGLGRAMAMAPERERAPAERAIEGAVREPAPSRGLAPPNEFGTNKPQEWGDFLTSRQFVVPLLTGLGAMASSPSRYLGSAVLQGIGAGAQAYGAQEKQVADVEKTRAETRSVETGTFQKSLMQTPFGNVVWLYNGSLMPLGEYDKLSKAGKAPALLGRIPDNAEEVLRKWKQAQEATGAQAAPTAEEAAKGAIAPVTPVEKAPLPPSGLGYDPESVKTAEREKNVIMSGGAEAQTAQKVTDNYLKSVVPMATAARDSARYLTELAANLSDAAQGKGLDAPGFGFDARAQATSALNTLSRSFGGAGDFGQADSISEINKKIETLQAAVQAAGGNQESFAALNALRNAIASPSMSPRAFSKLSSDLLVQNQRAIDREQHRSIYAQDSSGLLSNAAKDFERTNPASKYTQEADVLQRMILTQPKLIKDLRSGKYTPAQIDEAFDKFGVKGMSRYFVGGR